MKIVLNHSFHIKIISSDKKAIYNYIMNTSEVKNGLKHVFIPMGADFNYLQAGKNFKLMDKIMEKFNLGRSRPTSTYVIKRSRSQVVIATQLCSACLS